MAIQLKGNHMWILDGETNDVVERFPVAFIQQPTSFNDQNHIYNNILIFTVQLPNENPGELHIFQCVSHDAINLVDDIYHWMKNYGVAITDTNNSNNGNYCFAKKKNSKKKKMNHHHHLNLI
ncbi:Phosphotyrosine-binding domain containing protein [Sarcoptes scabiei]|uniref:Phosphotyrosine-binding domain containing protein n=1 Tax=Sarcoptes scabiei TaxID=52283 RepID=A0A132ACZ9_SARSC|nr:Phosphotyrosine-binding domain containing protein [Sarcoptes scabiei]